MFEDSTGEQEAAGTEDMAPRETEPFPLPQYITGSGTAHPVPTKKRRACSCFCMRVKNVDLIEVESSGYQKLGSVGRKKRMEREDG